MRFLTRPALRSPYDNDIDTAALRCFVSAVRTVSMGRPAEALATRYDKLAANYLAFVQLASIRLWLRGSTS
jgi:transposase